VGVLVYGNDFEDNLNSRDDTRPYCVVEDGKVVLKNLPVAESIGGSVRSFSRMSYALTHLRFYHNVLREYIDVAKRRVKRWAKKRKEGSREHREIHGQDGAGDEEPSMEEAVTVFEHALGRMVELCRNGGVRLFVVYVPTGDNIASGRPEYEHIRIVQRACRRYDIPLVDLMPDFIAGITGKEGEPYYFTHDLHWTPEGHRLAADILFQRVFGGRPPETPNQPPAAAASGG
jgi:hypothetical protein